MINSVNVSTRCSSPHQGESKDGSRIPAINSRTTPSMHAMGRPDPAPPVHRSLQDHYPAVR